MSTSSTGQFDVYLYQLDDANKARGDAPTPTADEPSRTRADRRAVKKQRDRAASKLKRRATDFLAQAGELRKAVAHLSTPEYLVAPTVFRFFEDLIPRINSVFEIAAHFQRGLKGGSFPAGFAGLEFLLHIVKNLLRQIESALAVAQLESDRCRRRPAYFDVHRLLEQVSRCTQHHYIDGDVGLAVNPSDVPLQVRGKRALWYLALIDLLCRSEDLSPRKGFAVSIESLDDTMRLTVRPRGSLIPKEESEARKQRQLLLGRSAPETDATFGITTRLIDLLDGSLRTGKPCRSHITPLFVVDIPIGYETDRAG